MKIEEKKKVKKFIVVEKFTFDKLYLVGSTIELTDEKTIKKLISNKLIK